MFPPSLPIAPASGPMNARVRPPGSKSITNRALLVAALAEGTTTLEHASRSDDTEVMSEALRQLGIAVEAEGDRFVVRGGGGRLAPGPIAIELGNAITGGRIRIEGLGARSLQGDLAFVHVLERMGCGVRMTDDTTEVVGTARLTGIDVDLRDISDTAQTLSAVAVFADGPTRISGVGFVRRKESDRIGAVVGELRRAGIEAIEHADGLTIHPGTPRPARVETHDDHRMAMSFALLGLRAPGIVIADPACVTKTYPGYFDALSSAVRSDST